MSSKNCERLLVLLLLYVVEFQCLSLCLIQEEMEVWGVYKLKNTAYNVFLK